jgi:hypothetical protein
VSESTVAATVSTPAVSESNAVVAESTKSTIVSEKEKQVCGAVLKSGANKGKPCGKACGTGLTVCASHK